MGRERKKKKKVETRRRDNIGIKGGGNMVRASFGLCLGQREYYLLSQRICGPLVSAADRCCCSG